MESQYKDKRCLPQKTIKRSISSSGVGTHSGQIVKISLHPAPVDSGISFIRCDVQNIDNSIKADWQFVSNTTMCTCISNHSGIEVKTIEHLLSALYGVGVDNLIIELSSEEVPIFDGSSSKFIEMIQTVGISSQPQSKKFLKVLEKVTVEDGNRTVSLEPSDKKKLTLSVGLDFSARGVFPQHIEIDLKHDTFIKQISQARTFGFYQDVKTLLDRGLIKGSSLENAVVIENEGKIMNPEGLRFDDELVRHKVLDAVGDLALAGMPIIGRFVGFNCGHTLNQNLLKKLISTKSAWQIVDCI